jgi:hypothetical protein
MTPSDTRTAVETKLVRSRNRGPTRSSWTGLAKQRGDSLLDQTSFYCAKGPLFAQTSPVKKPAHTGRILCLVRKQTAGRCGKNLNRNPTGKQTHEITRSQSRKTPTECRTLNFCCFSMGASPVGRTQIVTVQHTES